MLDKQLFQDEKFHPYLTQNFLLFRAHRGQPDGEAIYQKFSVRATPTVMIVTSDGREIDRVLGYDPPPEKFKDKLEATFKSENTFLNLNQAYKKDTTNLAVIARLAEKYRSNFLFDKMARYSEKLLQQPEQARLINLSVGDDQTELSGYEFAKFASTYSGPAAVLEFASEFPNSKFRDEVFRDFWRSLLNKDQQGKALEVFDQLNLKFPSNEALINSYLRYCSRSKSNYERGIELADRLYQTKGGKIDLDLASAFADLLIEKGETKKVQKITQGLIKNYPDRERDIYMQLGFLYQNKKDYENAFQTFENLIKNHPDHYPAYYQIGRTAAYSGKNLDKGIKSLKKYLQSKPEEGQPTLANAHFRLAMLYEHQGNKTAAVAEYEAALKLDPSYEDAQKALEKLKEK